MRVDRLANEPSIEADGIARVYDAHHDRKTFLFVARAGYAAQRRRAARSGRAGSIRGQPDQDSDCVPAGSVLQPRLEIVCPRRTARALAAAVEKGTTALTEAQAKLAAAASKWPQPARAQAATAVAVETSQAQRAAEADLATASAATALAEKHLATCAAELASVEARVAADNARYALPPAADLTERTARPLRPATAAAIFAAEEALLAAEQKIAGPAC